MPKFISASHHPPPNTKERQTMNGLIYHIALQAHADERREALAASARRVERPSRRRIFRRSF